MMKFRKKPVVVDAVKWNGDNFEEVEGFDAPITPAPDKGLYIDTLEGKMLCRVGDWIIKGVKGEYYPCKPDVFDQTYEPAE